MSRPTDKTVTGVTLDIATPDDEPHFYVSPFPGETALERLATAEGVCKRCRRRWDDPIHLDPPPWP